MKKKSVKGNNGETELKIGWKAMPLKEKISDPASIWFFAVMVIYLIQAVFAAFYESSPPLVDFFTVTPIIIIAFILHLLFRFNRTVPITLGIGFMFHILGLYKIIPYNQYYVGELYGAPQLYYHYDWIVHIMGVGFMAIALSSVLYPYLKRAFDSRFMTFLILILCTVGLGSLNEVVEFMGYGVYGYGEGFLEFGSGDSSPSQGPWTNSCTDMLNNTIGSVVFIGAFVLNKKYGWFSGSH
ncbi:hypothetical protein COV19_06360 [Candidatus Woesearchaeota archaeon CG10_big_fil_rev_8_21_14_0_10_44_13]|nr:MAG: hypothetical protein COV19_06360 [Candidatus Woesearchaeota archaeon CG10_big_fil_rev_8_21_14_0_10_44_13]